MTNRVPYAGIICPAHNDVDIDHGEYMRQMRDPNAKWKCPKCGSISQFNDERFEQLNPQPED